MTDSIFEADELAAAQDASVAPAEDLQPAPTEQQPEAQPAPIDDRVRGPDGKFAPKDDPEGGEEKPRMVNYGALKEAREKGKQWQQEAEGYKATLNQIAELRARVAGQPQQPQPIKHDPETDPTGVNFLAQSIAQLQETEARRTQQQQFSEADQQERRVLESALVQSESEFRSQAPDYDAAMQHLAGARARELHMYGMAPSDINVVISQEALELTANAVRMGISPAAMAYEIAQHRGYRTSQAAPAQPAQPVNPAVAMIQAVNKGQAASRSLGGAGGAAPAADINAQALHGMSQDEFDRLYSTAEGRQLFDKLMGG